MTMKIDTTMTEVNEQMVEAAEVAVYGRHERGFINRPLIGAIDMRAAITAALAARPKATHRHKKRGWKYRVLHEARMQIDGDLDHEKMVVYQGDDGQVWVRPAYEFNDGRFEAISALEDGQ